MNTLTPNKAGQTVACLIVALSMYSNLFSATVANPMPMPRASVIVPSPTPVQNPNEYIKIDLNHITQERNLCVPTCASMMLAKFGWNYPPRQLKLMTLNKTYYGPNAPFTDYTAMKFSLLIDTLRSKAAIYWREAIYSLDDQGFQLGLYDMKNSIRRGFPVMIGIYINGNAHVVVVCGFDEAKKRVIIDDPALRAPGLTTYTYSDLKNKYWSNIGSGFLSRSLVIMY